MNRAIGTYGGSTLDDFTESNQTGRFWHQVKGLDPFGNPRRHIMGYYVTAPGGIVACPPDGKRSFLSLLQDEIIGEHYSVACGVPEVLDLSREIAGHLMTKRNLCPLLLQVHMWILGQAPAFFPCHLSLTALLLWFLL